LDKILIFFIERSAAMPATQRITMQRIKQ
jgi:hypothetical protein